MVLMADGASALAAVVTSCICRDGFIPNPVDSSRCLNATVVGADRFAATLALAPSAAPTLPPTLLPTMATLAPTLAPSFEPCPDGNHGCDPDSSRCRSVSAGNYAFTTCQCNDGFVPAMNTTLRCDSITPSPTTSAYDPMGALSTPAPSPLLDFRTTSQCNGTTSLLRWKKFCVEPDRNLSLWTFPGSTDIYCEKSSVVQGIESVGACVKLCQNLGGPPHCAYVKYRSELKVCIWSPVCNTVLRAQYARRRLQITDGCRWRSYSDECYE
jgi:hypothetical protein